MKLMSDNDDIAKLRFYQRSLDEFIELPLDKAQEIVSMSWYDSGKTTVIFAHGFSGFPNGTAVTVVVNTFLKDGRYNVALLNWQKLAAPVLPGGIANSYLNWAFPNSKKLGVDFAETLVNLSAAGINLNKTHLVGHSLGAHIFGIAGNTLMDKGILLPWITGLDPATVGFENKPPAARLNPKSANFVSVIHSDPSKYGYKKSLGTVDFWPNYSLGTVTQPGCDKKNYPTFSPDDLCNHNRCWEILVDSVIHPGTIIGCHAQNFRKWRKYTEEQRLADVLEVGVFAEDPLPGNYYFITNAESPYGLGVDGL
ncbi:lipase member H-B-like isoform X2 [Plodia interpunctella]|uniref:lipase member H-B-like isoform X2 n=1 Tax=Plodia interpunctella TaxID=58824 RepID=UPI0023681DFF|nr:lipase member H-B-like isoform X2 [Plodia interpunctella]